MSSSLKHAQGMNRILLVIFDDRVVYLRYLPAFIYVSVCVTWLPSDLNRDLRQKANPPDAIFALKSTPASYWAIATVSVCHGVTVVVQLYLQSMRPDILKCTSGNCFIIESSHNNNYFVISATMKVSTASVLSCLFFSGASAFAPKAFVSQSRIGGKYYL